MDSKIVYISLVCLFSLFIALTAGKQDHDDPECHEVCGEGGLCYGNNSDQCCHRECTLGCGGPNSNQCWHCKHYLNKGSCVADCPPLKVYDKKSFSIKDSPDGRYTHGVLCVKECPSYMFIQESACVHRCSEGKLLVNNVCQ